MARPSTVATVFSRTPSEVSLISGLAERDGRQDCRRPLAPVKTIRPILVCLLLAIGGNRSAIADELDDWLTGLGRVANEGNYDYPLRLLRVDVEHDLSDPRVTRFRAALLRARENKIGAAADAAVPVDSASAGLPKFAQHAPIAGKPFTTDLAGISMMWIPAGKLLMSAVRGSDDDTVVTLSQGYWLGRTEVTQAEWAEVMDNVPHPSRYKGANRPVEQISWVTAMAFCRKLTEAESVAGHLPAGYEYSLPTEAQWEFACRAGGSGNAPVTPDAAWCIVNSERTPHAVGLKSPNAWGLYDMHGNVWEWCVDGYQGYPGGEVTDLQAGYTAPSAATFRILRGGGFMSTLGECRADYRGWLPLNAGNSSIGLRLALVPRRVVKAQNPDGG